MSRISYRVARDMVRHVDGLCKLYPSFDPFDFDKLRRLEMEGGRLGLRLCNGPELSEEEQDKKKKSILDRTRAILGDGPDFFLNLDPRGYALKLTGDSRRLGIHTDFGGAGIIYPTFS